MFVLKNSPTNDDCWRAFLIVTILFLGLCRVLPADFYVATNGNDINTGSRDAPFRSFNRAQAAVRSMPPITSGSTHVWFRGGTYYLAQTITFDPRDSGTTNRPIIYSAFENESVVLSGAQVLTPKWEVYPDNTNIMVAQIGTGLDFDVLYVNGAQQVLARYPNYEAQTTILNGFASDCLGSNRVKGWAHPVGGYVRGLHGYEWGGNSFTISGVDSNDAPILQAAGDNNRGSSLHKEYRLVENIFEELDAPGEWFYDKAEGRLYFYPPREVNLPDALIEAATLSGLIVFSGSSTNHPAANLVLSGFTFTQTHRTLFNSKYEGLMRGDWAVARVGAILMSNAEAITIQSSIFTNLGGNGIFVDGYARNIVINGNEFVNVGATCVQVVGLNSSTRTPSSWSNQITNITDQIPGPLTGEYPKNITISSNHMENLGVFEKQSAGVNISVAEAVLVSHNSIHRSPRSGINVNDGCFGGHVIEFNDVWDCVRETGDHGPFNAWGRDRYYSFQGVDTNGRNGRAKRPYAFLDCWKPIIIRNNRFEYSTVQTWGIDLDDGASNYEIYGNLCLNTGFKLREGFNRHVFNNIVINQSGNFHVWFDECGDQVDHNIIVNSSPWATVGLKESNFKAKEAGIDTNFFWNGGDPVKLPFSGWTNAGCDVHSLTEDPQFKDIAAGDFTVQNARILSLGFTNIPMNFGKPGAPKPPPVSLRQTGSSSAETWEFLGAKITGIFSAGIVSATGLGDTNGVYFQSVPPGSDAARQGFRENDVLRKADARSMEDVQHFRKYYENIPAGSVLKILLWRNQSEQTIQFSKP